MHEHVPASAYARAAADDAGKTADGASAGLDMLVTILQDKGVLSSDEAQLVVACASWRSMNIPGDRRPTYSPVGVSYNKRKPEK